MHSDLLWRLGIPALQLAVCLRKNTRIEFLRVFLLVEASAELLLACIFSFGGKDLYLYAWLAGSVLHQAMCGFLLANVYHVIRLRGLPSRQSRMPIFAMAGLSGGIGFGFARASMGLVFEPTLRMFLPLDHALSFAIGCMLVMAPFYCFAISSSIPRPVYLVLVGFGIYETAYAGLLGLFITRRHLDFPHAIDVVFILSLFIWSVALRSKNPKEAEELLPVTH